MTVGSDQPGATLVVVCGAVAAIMTLRLGAGLVVGLVGRRCARRGHPLHALKGARRWLGVGVGLALVAVPGRALAGGEADPTTAVMVPLEPVPTRPPTTLETTHEPSTAVMRPLDPAPPDAPAAGAALPPPATSTPEPASPPEPEVASHRWIVAPGEHLWHIAHETLAERASASAAAVSDREVAAYLAQLVALNRDVLVDPGNPDLIFPGQVMRLP